jgi:hypothetical protein
MIHTRARLLLPTIHGKYKQGTVEVGAAISTVGLTACKVQQQTLAIGLQGWVASAQHTQSTYASVHCALACNCPGHQFIKHNMQSGSSFIHGDRRVPQGQSWTGYWMLMQCRSGLPATLNMGGPATLKVMLK